VRALAGMLAGEVTVGQPEIQGDKATVSLSAGPVELSMSLTLVDGLWKITSVSEVAATTGG